MERSAEDEAAFQLASGGGSAASTPKLGGAVAQARGGSGDWGRPAGEESPWFNGNGGGLEAQQPIAQQAAAGGETEGAGKVIGTGTVLHTFVGDYNQPEELSVFEGDKVRRQEGGWLIAHQAPVCGPAGLFVGSYKQPRGWRGTRLVPPAFKGAGNTGCRVVG